MPFGSDERFGPQFGYNQPYKPLQHYHIGSPGGGGGAAARRHSSHSHENILQMKFQPMPQIDPRYRDSRPFVSSASNLYEYNAKRDFFARRRSSSSLQDDVVHTLHAFQTAVAAAAAPPDLQKHPRRLGSSSSGDDGPLGRRSSGTINTSVGSLSETGASGGGASRWDLNPAIFVEEFDDERVAAQAAQAAQATAAAAEVSAPDDADDADDGEIPYIDDEDAADAADSERSEPIYVPPGMQSRDYAANGRKAPPVIRNRKTVSFDLAEHPDDATATVVAIRPSHTCGHISETTVRFDDCLRPMTAAAAVATDAPLLAGLQSMHLGEAAAAATPTDAGSDGGDRDSDEPDNDSLSAYFDDDGFASLSRSASRCGPARMPAMATASCRPLDEDAVALDLSALRQRRRSNGDALVVAAPTPPLPLQQPPLAVPELSPVPPPRRPQPAYRNRSGDIVYKELRPVHRAGWVPTHLYDRLAFGNGKVHALRALFEQTQRHRSLSSPDLRRSRPPSTSTSAAAHPADRLTAVEQQSVMRQLRQWSEFGSRDSIASSPVSGSLDRLDDVPACPTCAALVRSPAPTAASHSDRQLDIHCARRRPSSPAPDDVRPLDIAFHSIRRRDAATDCALRRAHRCDCRQYWAHSVPELFARPERRHRLVLPPPGSGGQTVRRLKHAAAERARGRKCTAALVAGDHHDDDDGTAGR